jgi:hypothetical protein
MFFLEVYCFPAAQISPACSVAFHVKVNRTGRLGLNHLRKGLVV